MVEASYFACGGLDDDIAQRDLAVATQSNGGAAASRQNGSAVVSVHGDAEIGSGTPGIRFDSTAALNQIILARISIWDVWASQDFSTGDFTGDR